MTTTNAPAGSSVLAGVPAQVHSVTAAEGPPAVGAGPGVATELGDQIVAFAGRLASATCRWLLLIAQFDTMAGHERYGMPCTSSWLAHWCGLSRRTAVEHVRVARTLAQHQSLAQAMERGRLSYSQVRAISRVAEPGGDALIATLIGIAENGTVAQLESVIAGLRTVDDLDPTRAPALAREYLRSAFDEGSYWRLAARMAPEDGALIDAALARVAETLPPDPPPSDDGVAAPTRPALVRALIRLAELGIAALAADTSRPARHEPRDLERAAVVIHLDAGRVPSEPRPGTDHAVRARRPSARVRRGPGLPDRVVQKLLCDGRIRTVVERRGPDGRRTPLDLGRTRRVVSEKLFRALLLRDECCQRPGCGATTSLQAHHVRHWLFGGETNLGNLVLLCDRHHREHHEGRLQIVTMAPGCFQMRHLGLDLPTGPAPNRIIGPAPALEDDQEHVACDAARGGWDGERLDRRYAVGVAAAIRAAERVAREQQEPAA